MRFNPNDHDRFRSQRSNDELFRQSVELIRYIQALGLERFQIQTELGVVLLQVHSQCPQDDCY